MLNLLMFVAIFVGGITLYILPPIMCGALNTTRLLRSISALVAFGLPIATVFALQKVELLPWPNPVSPPAMETYFVNEFVLHAVIGFALTWLAYFWLKRSLLRKPLIAPSRLSA